jgi:NADPH:quinone reductase-like Zn-dependent oxidoreductase/SAM-dependent methyltransferase
MEQLISRLDNTNAEGRFFMNVGRNLQAIIRGTADPLELMFQSGLAEKHYQEVCDKILCCKQLAIYLDALSHKHPHMKVLEVGAGTGSITGHVLDALLTARTEGSEGVVRFSQYDYTDISEAFFEKARERFAPFSPRIKYKMLNIEHDIESQGYEPRSYDLVVAAWVLHATQDLVATIRNVQRLLRPGGKLILLEITEPEILRNGFAFGTLPGWWLSSEAERRLSPCVSVARWTELLVENGFQGVDIVLPDYKNNRCKENSILIATSAQQTETHQLNPVFEEVTIVLSSESSLQNTVGEELRQMFKAHGPCGSKILSIGDISLNMLPRGSMLVFLIELDKPYLSTLDKDSFETLQSLLADAGSIVWVTCSNEAATYSPELHMVRGLSRVLSTEKPSRPFATLSFESVGLSGDFYARQVHKAVSASLSPSTVDRELEYIERGGVLLINRVYESPEFNNSIHSKSQPTIQHRPIGESPPLAYNISNPGLLDSICFEEDLKYYSDLTEDEIEIKVEAIGVNFRDVLVALGRYDGSLGLECAGTVTRVGVKCNDLLPGDRVSATIVGCSNTHARCHYQLAVKIPSGMSITEAASVPVTGVTAYHCLVTLANLQKDDSILIHSAAGGTGQMVLQIAQAIGAEVYVTVSNEEKRQLMKQVYGLTDSNIFYSRDAAFSRDVYRATNGRGVDVVVNSLAGELLLASWECIAPFGRFIELGKMDIEANSKLPMSHFRKNVTFYAVAVDSLSVQRPIVVAKALQAVLDLISRKVLKTASPLHVFPVSEIESALRMMQSGKNIGKTVLTFSPSDKVPVS